MDQLVNLLKKAKERLLSDSPKRVSAPQLARIGLRYAGELVSARVFLRGVDRVGRGVRTLGRPRIDNLGRMEIGDETLIRSVNVPVELATGPMGELRIGRLVRLNYGVSIGAMSSIRLGDRVRVGPYTMIIDTEFHDVYDRTKMPPPRPVVIEDDVWIGAKVSIMPGVTIGRGAVVGTSSLVSADVPPFTVVFGLPARVVRELDPSKFVVR